MNRQFASLLWASSHLNLLWNWKSSFHSDTRGRKHPQHRVIESASAWLFRHDLGLDIALSRLDFTVTAPAGQNEAITEQLICIRRESDITKERIQKILASGANVVLTTGGIDDMCLKYFVDVGAMAVRRVLKRDLKRIAKATGGRGAVARTLRSDRQLKSDYFYYFF